jgi:hypothetical protein
VNKSNAFPFDLYMLAGCVLLQRSLRKQAIRWMISRMSHSLSSFSRVRISLTGAHYLRSWFGFGRCAEGGTATMLVPQDLRLVFRTLESQ